jgi:excisionase family DNA binding protein
MGSCLYQKKDSDMTPNEELLNIKQVAAILNCHVTQVYKMIKRGDLPPMIKFGERMSRMSRIQLEEHLRKYIGNAT